MAWTYVINKLVHAAAQLAGFRESAEPGSKADRRLWLNRRFQLYVEIGGGFIGVGIHDRFIRQDKERVCNDRRAIDCAVYVRSLRLFLGREEGDFSDVARLPHGGNGVADVGVFSLHQVQLHRDVKIRVRKVDDNRVILLFDVLDFEIRGVDFTLIRQRQKEQLLRRERMVSLVVLHHDR